MTDTTDIDPSTVHERVSTFCVDCDNLHPGSAKKHPRGWLCLKHPRLEGMGFVTPGTWVSFEPYMNCIGINGGNCPNFEPRKGTDDGHQSSVSE